MRLKLLKVVYQKTGKKSKELLLLKAGSFYNHWLNLRTKIIIIHSRPC